jgi:hypothetical protein
MIKQVLGLIVSYWLTPVYVRAEKSVAVADNVQARSGKNEATPSLRGASRKLNPFDGSNNGDLKKVPGVPEELWLPGDSGDDSKKRGHRVRDTVDREKRIKDAQELDKKMKGLKNLPTNEEEARKKFGEPRMGFYELVERQKMFEEDMRGDNTIINGVRNGVISGPQSDAFDTFREPEIPIPDGAPDNWEPPKLSDVRVPDRLPGGRQLSEKEDIFI